ncbi:MAG: succinate dehydrogenase, cytochrome b556 subunit [Alphaproteobacteria bacterium]|nr:succinate dehydrogenase, cytochrome b556 subunit [Alphaproteobacteria bacterium]
MIVQINNQATVIERPLSPHVQIYRWQLTNLMSILHRLAGMVLCVGTIFLTFVIVALNAGPDIFAYVEVSASSVATQIMLFAWTVCLYYHLFNGVRHLFWDAGYGFSLKATYASGYAVAAVSVVFSIATWAIALHSIQLEI